MSQVSTTLRLASDVYGSGIDGHVHWCPACDEAHRLPASWWFDGNLSCPSFKPSFRQHTADRHGNARQCHYMLTAGTLHYCGDCTHALAGQSVPLPSLPEHLRDA